VSAEDKGTGSKNKITITNDKGRLSQAEIDRMVNDAKKYEEEDKQAREKIEAKNGLENYAYSLRNTLEEPGMKDKIDAGDRESLTKAIDATIKWMEANQLAEKEEFEHKQKELEQVAMPIITKLYQGGGGMPGGMPDMGGMGGGAGGGGGGARGGGGASGGPTIEEVD